MSHHSHKLGRSDATPNPAAAGSREAGEGVVVVDDDGLDEQVLAL
jgi:hypothetical protein